MINIKLKLGKEIHISVTQMPKSKEIFKELIAFFNIRIREIFIIEPNLNTSLTTILNEVVNDAMDINTPNSHNFLSLMKSIGGHFYSKYDASNSEKR